MNRNDTLTLASRMRKMWHNLERIGVAAILEPNEQIVVLRKPTMREFREAVTPWWCPKSREMGSVPLTNLTTWLLASSSRGESLNDHGR